MKSLPKLLCVDNFASDLVNLAQKSGFHITRAVTAVRQNAAAAGKQPQGVFA